MKISRKRNGNAIAHTSVFNVITAARLLNCDEDDVKKLEADLKEFPPMQISKEGYLQEWLEDYTEAEVHHRHVSHLYGLHPGNLISPSLRPDLRCLPCHPESSRRRRHRVEPCLEG